MWIYFYLFNITVKNKEHEMSATGRNHVSSAIISIHFLPEISAIYIKKLRMCIAVNDGRVCTSKKVNVFVSRFLESTLSN